MAENIKKLIEESTEETKRHFDVVAEDLESKVQQVAEGIENLQRVPAKLDNINVRLETIDGRLDAIETTLEAVNIPMLKQKVAALEKRVGVLETRPTN